jgi:hypothetical protein
MLSRASLRQGIRSLFEPGTMPSDDVAGPWCSAYASYAVGALAGPVTLVGSLVPVSGKGPFFDILDSSFRAMWMSAVWAGPGVTAITTVVPPLQPSLQALIPQLMTSFDRELGPSLIAEAIHTYTLSIIVTVTPATGTPFTVTLT